uniref:Uncharacterized protein n=1 Tax=Graphocephala atropunctata TaxID=36148 RepID=A0A1B6KQX5_9HEMI
MMIAKYFCSCCKKLSHSSKVTGTSQAQNSLLQKQETNELSKSEIRSRKSEKSHKSYFSPKRPHPKSEYYTVNSELAYVIFFPTSKIQDTTKPMLTKKRSNGKKDKSQTKKKAKIPKYETAEELEDKSDHITKVESKTQYESDEPETKLKPEIKKEPQSPRKHEIEEPKNKEEPEIPMLLERQSEYDSDEEPETLKLPKSNSKTTVMNTKRVNIQLSK